MVSALNERRKAMKAYIARSDAAYSYATRDQVKA
jgi:hypothetical protein